MTSTRTSDWLHAALRNNRHGRLIEIDELFAEEIWRVATENGVLFLLHFKLKNTKSWDTLPHSFQKRINAASRNETIADMLRKSKVVEVINALDRVDIHPLIIKGTALAYNLYPEPHLRTRSDTDLLFSNREVAEKAWEALNQLGYQRSATVSGDIVSHQFSCYKSGPMGMTYVLDIHWRINNHPGIARVFPYEVLARQAIMVPSLSPLVKTLDHGDALLLACAHRIAHKNEGIDNHLRWLYDIHLLAESLTPEQWQLLSSAAHEKQLTSVCVDGLERSRQYFDTDIPVDLVTSLREKGKKESFTPKTESSRWRKTLSSFSSLPGFRVRLQFLREHLFPPADYMLQKYAASNRLQLPWLYLRRIAQGAAKRFRQTL